MSRPPAEGRPSSAGAITACDIRTFTSLENTRLVNVNHRLAFPTFRHGPFTSHSFPVLTRSRASI